MLSIGGAAAVTKEQQFTARVQGPGNQACCFKNRNAAITGNYCPEFGAFPQRKVNQFDGLFSIHLQQACSFTEPESR
jgi:hypothetical protein